VRAHPFYTEEPTEEEKEALEKSKEEAREGGGSAARANPVAQELLKAAKSLDGKLDFSTNAGRKQAVGEFLALVTGKVDLPENRNPKMEIGKLVMANSDKSAEEIMQVVFDKYGFAEAKQEKAAAKEASIEAACANPKNAALILAFDECAGVRKSNDVDSPPPSMDRLVLARSRRPARMSLSLDSFILNVYHRIFVVVYSMTHLYIFPSTAVLLY
jgi:hypothetical protein